MARVPLVQDDDEAARATGIFDTFRDEGRDPPDVFRALANVPGLVTAHRALPEALRGRENCPPRLRELAVLRLAQLVGSDYEWSHHRPMALGAGVTSDQAAALAGWRESAVFGPAERLVLAAAEAVHEMAVTDELFGDLEAGLGRAGAIELIVVLSQYEAVARIIQALGVEVEASHRHHLTDWLFALDLFALDRNATYRDSAGSVKGRASSQARAKGSLTGMVAFIIVLLVVGLIAGAIARLLMPGRDPLGILGTIVLGVAGSFVGGFLQNLVEFHSLSLHSFHTVGLIGSIIGAWLLLLLRRIIGRRPVRRY